MSSINDKVWTLIHIQQIRHQLLQELSALFLIQMLSLDPPERLFNLDHYFS